MSCQIPIVLLHVYLCSRSSSSIWFRRHCTLLSVDRFKDTCIISIEVFWRCACLSTCTTGSTLPTTDVLCCRSQHSALVMAGSSPVSHPMLSTSSHPLYRPNIMVYNSHPHQLVRIYISLHRLSNNQNSQLLFVLPAEWRPVILERTAPHQL